MTRIKLIIASSLVLALSLSFTLGCQITGSKTEKRTWADEMWDLQHNVENLAPYFFSAKRFKDPKNEDEIKATLLSFSKVVGDISPEKQIAMKDADPSLKFAMQELKSNVDQALVGFQNGQKEYSRNVLKLVLNQCFYCHTRNQFGPELSFKPVASEKLKSLNPIEKADLYVAFRNYDQALKELKGFITSSGVNDFSFDIDKAIRRYLAITVRVKKDPKLALEGIDFMLKRKDLATYLKEDVAFWKKALRSWQKELPTRSSDRITKAKVLMKNGAKLSQYPHDNVADVYYLRASSLLHDYMQTSRDQAETAEAMFLLGQAYESLTNFGSTFLSEFYYEACIRQIPRSPLAEKCYKRFEESVYTGYTGSSGTYIPGTVKERLKKLKALAYRPIWPSDL